MVLALPKLRWLVIGAIAAGVWVLREDMKGLRPPENVSASKVERSTASKPRPSKPLVAKPTQPRQTDVKSVVAKPVPPKPVAGGPAPPKAAAEKVEPQKLALILPKTVARPPAKPPEAITGSIGRPDKPTFVQVTSKVRLRAQARPGSAVIATLAPRTVLRELARSGEWRLVMGDGRKGWVHADYLAKPTFLPRRPKLPLAGVHQAKALAGAKPPQ